VPWKKWLVGALNSACTAVDKVAYRPAVVRLTRRLPRWWRCELARLSMSLDDRWGSGYWSSAAAPAAPGGLCDACRRRAAWLVVGGRDDEIDEPDDTNDFLVRHPVQLCGWCSLDREGPIRNRADLGRELARARARSVAWRWP